MRKNNPFIHLISITILFGTILLGTAFYCTANTQENKDSYSDIIGYWQEYIINGSSKEKTSIRKITLNDEGNLTQSITYEMATQCRIWLNNNDISYENGRLDFWGAEGAIWSPFVNQVFRDRVQMLASVTKSVNSEL